MKGSRDDARVWTSMVGEDGAEELRVRQAPGARGRVGTAHCCECHWRGRPAGRWSPGSEGQERRLEPGQPWWSSAQTWMVSRSVPWREWRQERRWSSQNLRLRNREELRKREGADPEGPGAARQKEPGDGAEDEPGQRWKRKAGPPYERLLEIKKRKGTYSFPGGPWEAAPRKYRELWRKTQ